MKIGLSEHAPGLFAIYGPLLNLDKSLDAIFLSWAHQFKALEYSFPQFLAVKHLERLQYFTSFPHLATFAVTLDRDEDELTRFSHEHKVLENGSLELPKIQPSTHVITPAACYHAYVEFEGQQFDQPKIITTRGICCRCEDHYVSLERQWTFSMRYNINIATTDGDHKWIKNVKERVDRFITKHGIDIK